MEREMYGYKGFNSDLTCRDFQYELGKTFKYNGEIALCESGIHFCKTLADVLWYYDFSNGNRFCKVKATGKIIEGEDKCVTDEIEILEEIVITPEVLNELAQNEDWYIRKCVAGNPNTDLETLKLTLKLLAEDTEWHARIVVAMHPNTDLETLKKLAEDEIWYVRAAVACNSNTDLETLKLLAKDKDPGVRQAVAKNSNTDLETLKKLAVDKDEIVRQTVAENTKYKVQVLRIKFKFFELMLY